MLFKEIGLLKIFEIRSFHHTKKTFFNNSMLNLHFLFVFVY